jgi:hypothetical protein
MILSINRTGLEDATNTTHTVTRGCMCSGGRFLLMDMILIINRAGLEDATNTTPHGNQRLHVQWWKAPVDGHIVSETCRAT